MTTDHAKLRTWAPRLIVGAIIGVLYLLSVDPHLSATERKTLGERFRFTRSTLPMAPGFPTRTVRPVNQNLHQCASWMSSMGASIALADLDGDGLPNDVCHIDTRTDVAMVSPVPGTPARYAPIVLDPAPLRFSRDTMAPIVCVPSDLNEDGRLDILVTYWGRTPILYLRTDAGGYVARELVEGSQEIWNTGALATADLDGDGHVEVIVGNYFQDGAPILGDQSNAAIHLQDSMSRAYNGGRTHIFRRIGGTTGREPTARFEEVNDVFEEEVARGWTLAIGARDLDGDLLPELYLAHDFGPDRLLHNRSTPGHLQFARLEGERRFSSARSKVLGRDSFKGMGVDFADLNDDGHPDIFVSNLTSNALMENHFTFLSTGDTAKMKEGRAPYVDRSEPLGLAHSCWAWDAKMADFDNDGGAEIVQSCGFVRGEVTRWPELEELAMENDRLMGSPHTWPRMGPGDDLSGRETLAFFVRHGARFFDAGRDLGLGEPMVTRGVAVADVDGDGDLDFAVANQWDSSYAYRNDCPRCGASLGLHLRLPLAPSPTEARPGHPRPGELSRPAVGAQAVVRLADGRRFIGEVDGGNGHSGKRSPDLHFGLGAIPTGTLASVELRWRDPKGRPHQETRQLPPGWHTLTLGWEP